MPHPKTLLLVDFDNTISIGDTLDAVIERFSRSRRWEESQAAWRAGRMSTRDCLVQQIEDLQVGREDLLSFLANVRIDPGFAGLQEWADRTGADLLIVSDNFEPLVRSILAHNGVPSPRIFANALAFEGDSLRPSFPWSSASCPGCAHCKSVHYARYPGSRTIYVGDGGSDFCAARRAEIVYAKDRLAEMLAAIGKPFLRYASLAEVSAGLDEACRQAAGGAPAGAAP